MGSGAFWQELKRRHVYRVAAAYVIVGWLLIQVVTQVFPVFHVPDWIDQVVVLLILIGFPIALVLAWAFDATPQGIVRTDAQPDAADTGAMPPRRSRHAGIAIGLIGVAIALIAGGAYWHFERGRTVASHAVEALIRTVGNPGAAQRSPERVLRDSAANASASSPGSAQAPIIATQPIPAKSIAVLPFENLSTDKGNAYFADGMQDLILTKLADIGDLKVISRTSTESYGSHPGNLKVIAQQLGVATILEGSVQKAGNQVLINVQLIDANTDSHIWAQSYQRTLDNIFGVEGEVAQKVADALKAKLTAAESQVVAARPTDNPAAYDAYLRGVVSADRAIGSPNDVRRTENFFAEAVRLDPTFALAWARLSMIQSFMYADYVDRTPKLLSEAKQAADTALKLAPDLGEGYLARGVYHYYGLNDYAGALSALQQARLRLPNNANVLATIGYIKRRQGKWSDAMQDIQAASKLDPRNTLILSNLADTYSSLRQFPNARTVLDQALNVTPDSTALIAQKASAYQAEGDLDAAGKLLDTIPLQPEQTDIFLTQLHQFYYRRRFDLATAALKSALANYQPSLGHYYLAAWYGSLSFVQRWTGDHAAERATSALWLVQMKILRKSGGDDAGLAIYFARAYAGLGDKANALREAKLAVKNNVNDATALPSAEIALAEVETHLGNDDAAIATLPHLLEIPGGLTVAELKLDPFWDPLRHDPRFQALLKKYANAAPAPASTAVTEQE